MKTRAYKRPNFKALRIQLKIEDVCEYLNIELKRSGKVLRSGCPICQSESTRCFVVTPDIGLFYCFICREHGDSIELFALVKQLTQYAAACQLEDLYRPSS